ncbi:F-box domain protein [Aspergillus lucknowensis]|uniref:F-box domain-containing protein n=1 Tax=Aspergillus lucknowensis TaxID=176173 RepID=A0ABR4LKJ0_9EURO
MGLLSRLRGRSKSQSRAGNDASYSHLRMDDAGVPPLPGYAIDLTKQLPRPVLARIFTFVCPHAVNNTYDTSEESMTEDGCMLCDMRDLAHCALVSRRWYPVAQPLLYSHVRIDAVHYCELEEELAAKRKRRSFFDRNADPIDAPQVRLSLFMRTVRLSRELANLVLSLRMPYMTREASKAEIARTISVLSNLRYVDLPSGIYSDDPSCLTLKQELMARCPDLRRMTYRAGAEGSFSQLPDSNPWSNLEILELSNLQIEPSTFRISLASFPRLHDLAIDNTPLLDDSIFSSTQGLPPFPAIQRLTLRNTPNITTTGITEFLKHPLPGKNLLYLTLSSTGVPPATLHTLLSAAPSLLGLLVIQEVTRSFPPEKIPPLSSQSLQLLHYEITSPPGTYGVPPKAASYYTYLISTLMSNSLPALRDLYVRDADFPEALLLAPPPRLYGGGESGPQYVGGGLARPLNVFSKGLDELEWNFTPYEPLGSTTRGRRDSATRPVSFHDASLSRSWGGDARKSVLVGNGFGGFLAVPVEEERAKSSGGWKRDSRGDLWR